MSVQTYNPKNISLVFDGHIVVGFSEGTFINVERDVDTFTKTTGAHGSVVRSKSPNDSGRITFTLQQTSLSNDVFSAFQLADEDDDNVIVSTIVKDLKGNSVYQSSDSWIVRPASAGFDVETGPREWMIDCAHLKILNGGTEPNTGGLLSILGSTIIA